MYIRQDIELLRIIGAFAIVWFHSGAAGHQLSYTGLILFLVISMYLAGQSSSKTEGNIAKRARRLLVPWLAWFIFYGVLNLLLRKPFIPATSSITSGILSGSSIHLWFMPFLFMCLVFFDIARKYLTKPTVAWLSALSAIIALCSTSLWREGSMQLGPPLAQYAHAIPGVLFGVFLAYAGSLSPKTARLLLIAIFLAAIPAIPYLGVGFPYLLGMAVSLVLIFPLPALDKTINIASISQCTLGIYFIHVFFLVVANKFIAGYEFLVPITAFILSFIAVYYLRKLFPSLAKYWG